MQNAKSEELLKEKNRMNKAACIIMRCVRNYSKAIRKGMGFTLRRQGAIPFPLALPATLRFCIMAAVAVAAPRSHAFEQLICEKRLARCRVPRRRAALHNKKWLSALLNSFYLQTARQSPIEFLWGGTSVANAKKNHGHMISLMARADHSRIFEFRSWRMHSLSILSP